MLNIYLKKYKTLIRIKFYKYGVNLYNKKVMKMLKQLKFKVTQLILLHMESSSLYIICIIQLEKKFVGKCVKKLIILQKNE